MAVPWKQVNAQVDMKFPEISLVVSVDPSKGFESAGTFPRNYYFLLNSHNDNDNFLFQRTW